MDAIALHQHGVKNTVATLGTALSTHHWTLISRYAKDLYLVFDGDAAGRRATLRGIEVLLPEGALPLAVTTPDGDDPDTFIRKRGKESFDAILAGAKDPIKFWLDCHLEGKDRLEREDRVVALREVAPIVALSRNPVRRSDWALRIAQRLGLRQEDVLEEIKGVRGKSHSLIALEEKVAEVDPCTKAKEGLIALLLAGRNIAGFLDEIRNLPSGTDLRDEMLGGLIDMVVEGGKTSAGSLAARFSPEAMSLMARIEALEPIPENHAKAARDYVATIRQECIARKDTDDLLTSLDAVQRLHLERISLGMGEGFRH
jgi:DNA primase